MNRFDSYLKGAKLARMQAQEAQLALNKGDDRRALRQLMAAFSSLLVATNNFASLQFRPRKKKAPWTKKQYAKLYPPPLLHANGDFPSDKRDIGGTL